jgi:hypothetical protein
VVAVREPVAPGGRVWPLKAKLAAVFMIAWIAVQIALPVKTLFRAGLDQFGWQMFSLVAKESDYTVQFKDGSVRPVDWNQYVGFNRGDIPLVPAMQIHMCEQLPDAVVVFRHDPGKQEPVEYRCNR